MTARLLLLTAALVAACGDSSNQARPAAPPPSPAAPSTEPAATDEPAGVVEPQGAAARPGALSIQVNGGWAEVWVDGTRATQETPLNAYELAPGAHQVRVSSPETGRTLLEERIDIQPEEMTILVIEASTGVIRRSHMEY